MKFNKMEANLINFALVYLSEGELLEENGYTEEKIMALENLITIDFENIDKNGEGESLNMITADTARERSNKIKAFKVREFANTMERNINDKVLKVSETSDKTYTTIAFANEMLEYRKEIFEVLKSKLEAAPFNFKLNYIEGTDGDLREPMDYGTPCQIEIRW